MHADLIGKPLQMPWRLRFDRDCLIVLRRSLLAVAPEEGCALLLGDSGWDPRVRVVWPCCNVWRPGQWGLDDQTDGSGSVNPGIDAPTAVRLIIQSPLTGTPDIAAGPDHAHSRIPSRVPQEKGTAFLWCHRKKRPAQNDQAIPIEAQPPWHLQRLADKVSVH